MVTTRSSKNGKITSFFEKKKNVKKEEIKEEEIGKTTNKKRKIDNNETTSTNLIKKVKKTTANKKEDKPLLNPVLGTDFDFEPIDTEKEMKIVSYNVGSLNASLKKGFKNYLEAENPDIICIQVSNF